MKTRNRLRGVLRTNENYTKSQLRVVTSAGHESKRDKQAESQNREALPSLGTQRASVHQFLPALPDHSIQ